VTARPVVVVDHGRGNLFSVCQAVAAAGGAPTLTADPTAVVGADRVVLPGVGAFGDAMATLTTTGLDEAIRGFAATGRPLLGVCLGMQLLFEESSEFGRHAGLGLLPGRVNRLPPPPGGSRDKIPNVGWCPLQPAAGGMPWSWSLLATAKPGDWAYFVHSFVAAPREHAHRVAEIVFGGQPVVAAVASGAITGCQFHPEKSGRVGLGIYEAFVQRA
jgi:imidazole glycerol-phosphate synthase subunit HisH